MNGNVVRGGLLVIALIGMVVGGLSLVACSEATPTTTPTPTKWAVAVGQSTPTPGPGLDQPIKMIWGQLPAEVQAYFLRQPAVVTPEPSDLIDFEVGKGGCRYTVVKNATEKITGSLAGDCVEILNALNPSPAPTATPTATPTQVATEFIGVMYDPRPDANGVLIEVRGRYGEWYATARRELEPGSGIYHIQALPSNGLIISGAVVYMTTDANGAPAVELDYWNGSAVRSELFVLDDWFPIKHLESEPTATPTPAPTGDGPFIWVANAGGFGLFLTVRVDENKMASVFSLREFKSDGTLFVDDFFVTSTVYEFRGAEMRDDGYVYIRYGTSAQGADIMIRHRPWFR
ncbi:MAG: hypothetical protein AAB486_04210 [Patescibacteria group bacterium]